ncbi:MAG: rod shape-determining protein MreC, partial [Opitutus sp.]
PPLDVIPSADFSKRLVTSGLGGVFPPWDRHGTITFVKMASDGLFKTGEVKLDERLGSLTEVTVLVPLSTE